jgi:ubiquinone/menaquinone biosynthesis C-methylase UbiE
MLDQARANLAGRSFSFEIIDAQVIPYDDATFDAVIANHMVYHIPDRAKALSEMRRVLNATGAAYLATNGQRHLRELYELKNRFDLDSDFGWNMRADELFSFDSGGEELRQWFTTVDVHRYHDNLVVTAAEPLVDYILSMTTPEVAAARRAELTAFVEAELQAEGILHITKDSGLLIARP